MITALNLWRRQPPAPHVLGVRHVMLCICDRITSVAKFERSHVTAWTGRFHDLTGRFNDADGSHPKHTLFLPPALIQKNEALGTIAEFAQKTGTEVEFHLPDPDSTGEAARGELDALKAAFEERGLLSRDETGAPGFAVLGGTRLPAAPLRRLGCYADFTPSAAGERALNLLHYRGDPASLTFHRVRANRDATARRSEELLQIPKPVCLDWESRRFRVLPRVERGELTAVEPPTANRLKLWMECHITVDARPNWHFIALHTSSISDDQAATIGAAGAKFHQSLAAIAATDKTIRFHYVSARELVNIIHAAEAGHSGDPGQFRDFRYQRQIPSAGAKSASSRQEIGESGADSTAGRS